MTLAETYAADAKPGDAIVVPIGQDELARLVGASRETVSRALNSYRRLGMLDTSHRRITITDLPGRPFSERFQPQTHAIISP